jgi:hypothetical protein
MENKKRLIDANELLSMMHRLDEKQKTDVWMTCDIEALLEMQPIVDAVEVVHGRWEKSPYFYGYVRCSICHDCNVDDMWIDGKKWKYCPNCGAKMDGGNEDG